MFICLIKNRLQQQRQQQQQQRRRQLQQQEDLAQHGQQQLQQQQFRHFMDVCPENSNVVSDANVFRKDSSVTENINAQICRMKLIVPLRRISTFPSESIRQSKPSEKEGKLCSRQVYTI